MDKLVLEREVAVEEKKETKIEETQNSTQETKLPELKQEETSAKTEYLKSLENITIGDFKKQEEEKKLADFEQEKEELIQKQFEVEEPKQESQNIIEKPNYDFIEENKTVIKLRKNLKPEAEKSKKNRRGVVIAVGLAICSLIAVTNVTLLDNFSSSLSSIEHEFYDINLPKYLKNIGNLDATKKSMEFIETYPEEMQNAGDIGEKTNWYDKLTNFISGVFGG